MFTLVFGGKRELHAEVVMDGVANAVINKTPVIGAYMRPFRKAYLCRYIWIQYTKSHMENNTALESSASEIFVPSIGFEQLTASKKVMVDLPRRISQRCALEIKSLLWELNPGICIRIAELIRMCLVAICTYIAL